MPTRKLEIELIGDSSSLSKSFRGAVRDADTFGSRLRHAGVIGAKVLGGALVAGAAAGTYAIVKSAEAAEEANKVHAQTGAVLKSTGHAAGVSQKQVESLAESIMRKTGIDDEAILTGQNLLLTFKNIRNEAGEGNDVFDQATMAMVDMSSAMGNDASSSAIQLGKALNDPIKGISALSKVGVSFSDQQKEQIEQWVESGETLRAQKAILKELDSEFGGSAEAQATAMEKIKTSVGNVEESVGNVFLPIIDQAATKLNRDLVPELQHTADGLARIAARKNIDMGEKLDLAGGLVRKQWGDVPEEIGEILDETVPVVASHTGHLGVLAARGMGEGFVNADIWGKLAIGSIVVAKLGGVGAFKGLGGRSGRAWGAGFLAAVLGLELAKEAKRIIEGHKLDSTPREEFATDLNKTFELPSTAIKFVGGDKVRLDTEIGDLVFNTRTQQLVSARSAQLRKAVGQVPAQMFDDYERALRSGSGRGERSLQETVSRLSRVNFGGGDDPVGIARGFETSWRKSGNITEKSINGIERALQRMSPVASQISGRMMIEMAQEMRAKGQLSKTEVERLRSAVITKLDAMARQGGKKGELFAGNLGGSFGVLDTRVAEALESMGANVGTILEKFGADNPFMNFTLSYAKAHGTAGKGGQYMDQVGALPGNARGGPLRVSGQGLQDTVPVAVNGALSAVVAPGEDLVVFNRHQRPLVDRALAEQFGVAGLPGFFDSFDRPHYFAKGGLAEPRISGPDPLRGGAQAGIHKSYLAAQEYLRAHRPKPTASVVAGYTGPPANMKQLGDNAWVDSHTAAVAAYLVKHFGVQITDGWRPQNASYGAANSSHKRGTPANPGAFDFAPPSTALQAFAGSHIAGLTENDIHDWGTGLHNHIAFFAGGGVITGKVSYFNGPSSTTASGTPVARPGLALNLNPGTDSGWDNETTRGWMAAAADGNPVYARTTIAGHTANLPIIDLGPSGFTGRAIDVTEGGVKKLGLDPASFPTDSIGKAVILDGSSSGGKGAGGKPKFHPHPGKTGKGGGTEGPGGPYPKGTAKTHGESVPGMAASAALPSAAALPQSIQNLLTAPGMDYAGRTAIGDLALQQAGRTEGTEDDRAAYNFQEELLKRRKERLQKRLAEIRAKLRKRHTAAEEKKLLGQQASILGELGSIETGLGSVREGRAGLDEVSETEEDPAVKAAEEAQRAAEEMKAAADQLKEEMQKTRQVAESEITVGLSEARRALADIISSELGPRSFNQAQTAGAGTLGTL